MYSLPGTRWYIAELIEEISVGDFPRQIIHRNSRFIFANSPDEAYQQAVAVTQNDQAALVEHENASRTRFWSLAHLNVVREDFKPVAEVLPGTAPAPSAWVMAAEPLPVLASD